MSEISAINNLKEKPMSRFGSIDTFRGLLVVIFFLSHTSEAWLRPEDQWLHGVLYIFLHILGPNAWLFASGISLTLSYESKRSKMIHNTQYSPNRARLSIWWRTLMVLIIGLITNLVSSLSIGKFDIWMWWVIQSIAVGRIVCYPFLRTKPIIRIIIGTLFFVFTNFLADLLIINSQPLYYLFYNPSHLNTPFPFFGYFFIGSAVGTLIYKWKSGEINGKNFKKYFNPRIMEFLGFMILSISLIFGLRNSNNDVGLRLLSKVNKYGYKDWDYIPTFLDGRSIQWCFLCLGIILIVFALLFRKDFNSTIKSVNIKSKTNTETKNYKEKIKFSNFFGLLGKYSLSIYNYHFIVYLIFVESMNIYVYFSAYMIFTIMIYWLFVFWTNDKYGKGIGTLEWIISVTHQKVEKLLITK